MANNTTTTGFSMYNPRRLNRTVFNGFQGCGIDLFTDPAAQNPASFLDLTNVMPTLTGGFVHRWGLAQRGSTLPRSGGYKRMFTYAAKQDVSFAGTANTFLILGTDDTHVDVLFAEPGSTTAFGIPNFGGNGSVHGITSRAFFYACDGVGQPKKVDYSQQTTNTSTNWGMAGPGGDSTSSTPEFLNITNFAAGIPNAASGSHTFTTPPTVVISGGGGSGATATANLTAGLVTSFTMGSGGSGYTSAPSVTLNGSGNTDVTPVVDLDSTSSTFGKVTALLLSGPLVLNSGRRYALAFQNSITGHVSDYLAATSMVSPTNPSTSIGDTASASYLNIQSGVSSILVTFLIPTIADPQVDTVLILATADGGDVSTLYQVASVPSSSFGPSGIPGQVSFTLFDTLPDAPTDNRPASFTLLTNNIWVEPDGLGGFLGIFGNTPPPNAINKPILHKGRMFATDGNSLFFSKSLSEVTTSTGLITSKWEEAWPGINQLDIAYGNETINALLSDGDVLYIGTGDNIYRLLGDSATNFSIPAAIFRGVGVSSQDAWSVIYKDDTPAGYMWFTPDNKIMLSDFNTYEEIGKYINPLFTGLVDEGQTLVLGQIQSVSYGPYSLALLSIQATNTQPTYLVWDTKSSGWYRWNRPTALSIGSVNNTALLSYTDSTGVSRIYTQLCTNYGTPHAFLQFFEPTRNFDVILDTNPAQVSGWSIQTSWLNLGDDVSFKVLNDVEVWSDDPNIFISVQRAISTQFGSAVVKSGAPVAGPLATKKLFLAGSPSCSRYFNFQFSAPTAGVFAAQPDVLRQFSVEHFPQTRL